MIVAPFDELNILQDTLERWRADWDPAKKPDAKLVQGVVDEVEYLLILAYVFGKDATNEALGVDIDVNETQMKDALFKKIEDKEFVDRIAEHMEHFDVPLVMRVAETEMTRDFNAGGMNTAVAAQKQTGRETEKTWHTMMDDRVRDTHDYLEGTTVGLKERFYTYDGDSAMHPGDFSKSSNNVGCRCILSYRWK